MKKAALLAILIGIGITVISVQSCSKSTPAPAVVAKPTLYDSLGGTALVTNPSLTSGDTSAKVEMGRLLIRNIIDSTIFVIAADTSINKYFMVLLSEVTAGNYSGYQALSKNLTDFVCVGTGATDFTYTGLSMHDAHDTATNKRISMLVDNGDFTEFEKDLFAGAAQAGVPATTPALISVGNIVESLRSQVVQR
jgi:hypothetical protein